jgi:hypothetical protein
VEKSKRLIRYTIVALSGIAVSYVGINRLYAISSPLAQRTPAAELATLHDFSEIEMNGDFGVDIVQGASYAVAFTASPDGRGNFVATMYGETLVLRGYGNASANRVRVALPALKHLEASDVTSLLISGFEGKDVSLRLTDAGQVLLRNNNIHRWHISAADVGELGIDRTSIASGQFDLVGNVTLKALD